MAATIEKAQVALPNDTDVVVTRAFNAPRALVWRAHTEPELLKRWMTGHDGWSFPVCEMDVRPGGKYRWRWRNDENGQEFGFYGEFHEISAPARFEHSEFFDPGDVGGDMGSGARITTEFAERDGVTTMTTTIRYKTKEEREAALSTGMTDGMEYSYQKLDDLLTKQI
ncbi:MAG: SRPBCC family protein [Hyphomonadaceae bacterium]